MFFKCVYLFTLIYLTINPALASMDQCSDFTLSIGEMDHGEVKFARDSLDITNKLTNQCRYLKIAIELDLYRDNKTSKYYSELYGDDLHKMDILYPIDSDVNEEIHLTPRPFELTDSPPIKLETHKYKSTETYENETTTKYGHYTSDLKRTTEGPTTEYQRYTTGLEETTEVSTTEYQHYTTDLEGTTEASTTATSDNFTNGRVISDSEKSQKSAIIAVSAVAAVALSAVILYFVAEMIKTKLQSGSFRFPESSAA